MTNSSPVFASMIAEQPYQGLVQEILDSQESPSKAADQTRSSIFFFTYELVNSLAAILSALPDSEDKHNLLSKHFVRMNRLLDKMDLTSNTDKNTLWLKAMFIQIQEVNHRNPIYAAILLSTLLSFYRIDEHLADEQEFGSAVSALAAIRQDLSAFAAGADGLDQALSTPYLKQQFFILLESLRSFYRQAS